MKKEACQRVEMSQSLLRPEELGTRVRSDVSLSGRSHSTHNIALLTQQQCVHQHQPPVPCSLQSEIQQAHKSFMDLLMVKAQGDTPV